MVVLVIAGNKMDLTHKLKIEEKQVAEFARKRRADYQMCSAKDNYGIEEIFDKIVDRTIQGFEAAGDPLGRLRGTNIGEDGLKATTLGEIQREDKKRKKQNKKSGCC